MNNLESLGQLERRLRVSLPLEQIDAEIEKRLQRLARTARVPGFRPGKVPLKMIAQQYGPQVRSEVMTEAVQESFADAVRTQNLRVAGSPRIEPDPSAEQSKEFAYSATFEVYPEVILGDLAALTIVRPVAQIDEADLDRTLEILRRQRAQYRTVDRPAETGDRVMTDFSGTIDGVAFAGGQAKDFAITLGEGRMLPEFEAALAGMRSGEQKRFALDFPSDYHGAAVAGKRAEFDLTVKEVAETLVPPLDAEFAKSLGVASGDIGLLRADIRANLELELKRKIEASLKEQVMQAFRQVATLTLPNSLVEQEISRMRAQVAAEAKAHGSQVDQAQLSPEQFRPQAEDRVRMSLIMSEVVSRHQLRATPEQVRQRVEESAQSYEQPEAVVAWHYQQAGRLAEFEAQALEHNLIEWVLAQTRIEDRQTSFAELAAQQSTAPAIPAPRG